MKRSSRFPLNKRLYIGKLDYTIDSETLSKILTKIFQQYGNLVGNPSVKQGFGFVEFDSLTSAKNAKEKENGRMIGMNKIIVDYAKQRNNFKNSFIQQKMFAPQTQSPTITVNLYITNNTAWTYAVNVQNAFRSNGIWLNIYLANQYIVQHVIPKEKYKIMVNPDNSMRGTVWFDASKGYFDTNIYEVIKFIKSAKDEEYNPMFKSKEYDPCTKQE